MVHRLFIRAGLHNKRNRHMTTEPKKLHSSVMIGNLPPNAGKLVSIDGTGKHSAVVFATYDYHIEICEWCNRIYALRILGRRNDK